MEPGFTAVPTSVLTDPPILQQQTTQPARQPPTSQDHTANKKSEDMEDAKEDELDVAGPATASPVTGVLDTT
jgi:hypothetical protein